MPSEKIQRTLAWLDDHGISYECHKNLDIHALEHMLHQGKLSFASPERMDRCLGVAPGSVCAFGLINDIDIAETVNPKELFDNGHRVKYFLDKELQTAEKVSFHPCDNTASDIQNVPEFKTREGMYNYLKENHDKVKEFWIRVNRSSKPEPGVIGYVDAVEVALCFGWIDSTLKHIDSGKPFQRFSPRRKGSNWYQRNIERCKRLKEKGEMTEYGLAVIPEGIL